MAEQRKDIYVAIQASPSPQALLGIRSACPQVKSSPGQIVPFLVSSSWSSMPICKIGQVVPRSGRPYFGQLVCTDLQGQLQMMMT